MFYIFDSNGNSYVAEATTPEAFPGFTWVGEKSKARSFRTVSEALRFFHACGQKSAQFSLGVVLKDNYIIVQDKES
jgi:hypothetical protein